MDKQLKKLCSQTLQYLKYSYSLGNGDKVYLPAVDVKCLIAGYQTVFVDLNGEEYVSSDTIYLDETAPIMGLLDKVVAESDRIMPIRHYRVFRNEKGLVEGAMLLV